MLVAKNGIMYIVPHLLPENILSFTTTRYSGYSKNNFSSFNLGYHVNDDEESVSKNYKKLYTVFNISKIVTINQIHSDKIVDLDKTSCDKNGDGIITKKENTPIGILTADCFNVQLIGDESIANLHCGWKSIYSGIIENALKEFDKRKEGVNCAVVGPGICENCYEVSFELVNKFLKLTGNKNIFLKKGDKFYINLRNIIKIKLENYVNNVIHLKYCTYCNNFLYSYRKNKNTGRMLSVLMKYE